MTAAEHNLQHSLDVGTDHSSELAGAGEPIRIGLTLSGGGFRATLFHLGVVRMLRDAGLLHRVRFVGGVSGGAILAAHLGLAWDRYVGPDDSFDRAAAEIVQFCQRDVRNRILRRWLLGWLTLVGRVFFKLSRVRLLISEYETLFGKKSLRDLNPTVEIDRPRIILQSVVLSTGNPCSFGRSGFMWYEPDANGHLQEREVSKQTSHLSVALAVAASSAFPPLFPPLRISRDLLHVGVNELPHALFVTDGGVYDNLGIERPLWYYEAEKLKAAGPKDVLDAFLVSDAGGLFDWSLQSFNFSLPRNLRATEIMMKRVGELLDRWLTSRAAHTLVRIRIDASVDDRLAGVVPAAAQRKVGRIRTDLNAFTPLEAESLMRHGYAVAREALIAQGWMTARQPIGNICPVPATKPEAGEWARTLEKSSSSGVVGLFALTDWPIWLVVLGMALAAAICYR